MIFPPGANSRPATYTHRPKPLNDDCTVRMMRCKNDDYKYWLELKGEMNSGICISARQKKKNTPELVQRAESINTFRIHGFLLQLSVRGAKRQKHSLRTSRSPHILFRILHKSYIAPRGAAAIVPINFKLSPPPRHTPKQTNVHEGIRYQDTTDPEG